MPLFVSHLGRILLTFACFCLYCNWFSVLPLQFLGPVLDDFVCACKWRVLGCISRDIFMIFQDVCHASTLAAWLPCGTLSSADGRPRSPSSHHLWFVCNLTYSTPGNGSRCRRYRTFNLILVPGNTVLLFDNCLTILVTRFPI